MKGKTERFEDKKRGCSSKTRRLAAAVVGALLIGAVIFAVICSRKAYIPLFRELGSDDMASALGYLQEQNVTNYKVEDDGTILVRKNQRALLKAQMLAAGFSFRSDEYTYDGNVGTLDTSDDRGTFLRLDLQERLADTIESYDNVQEATVFISPSEEGDAAASVVVTTTGGKLTDEVSAGIRRLVSQSAENLPVENVAIEDQDGNLYTDAE